MTYFYTDRIGKIVSSMCCFMMILNSGMAQNSDCACCTEMHGQFDFWVGEWDVYNKDGVYLGANHVIKLEDNCIVQENWIGGKGTTGSSYNYFNLQDSTWNQLWIDNTGSHLNLKGNLGDGIMILWGNHQVADSGKEYRNRITWQPNKDGSVTPIWDVITTENQEVKNLFTGIYRKN